MLKYQLMAQLIQRKLEGRGYLYSAAPFDQSLCTVLSAAFRLVLPYAKDHA